MDGHENPKGTQRSPRDSNGHVVNLRSWKARKRIRTIRGRTTWTRYSLRQLAYLLTGLTVASTLLSCFPSPLQGRAILWSWGAGVFCATVSLCLYGLHETRRANRFLAVNLICLCISFVAAITVVL